MGETPGSGRRKRARPATNGGTAAGSATKKRKVGDGSPANGEPAKHRSTGAPVSPARKKTSLDRNHAKAPIPQDDNDEEDGDEETTTTPVKKTAKRKVQSPKERGRDPYDLLPSDVEEAPAATLGKKGKVAAGASNSTKSKKRKSIPVTTVSDGDESETDVYDTMNINESPSKPPTEKKRGPGRPPGSKNKKTTAASLSANTHSLELTPTKSRQVRRGLEGDVPASPAVLKGILTPSKKRNDDTPRRRKNVAFSAVGEEKDFEIYFDDLPTAKKSEARKAQGEKVRTTPTRPGSKDTEEDELANGEEKDKQVEEDEDVCEICLKPDSNPPNEIIICDGCDLGFHQKCHNVPVIPEDDWFCKNCSQEDAAKTPQRPSAAAAAAAAAPPTDAPDIPNLDRHLAALQRVLLDRCTGKRRLKLVGLDEAYKKVEKLVEQTISGGESNSMLLIGGRGTGKTAVSNTKGGQRVWIEARCTNIAGRLSRRWWMPCRNPTAASSSSFG